MNLKKSVTAVFNRNLTFVVMLFISCSSFGFEKGDVVDRALLERLGYQDDSILLIDFFAEWCESCRKELPLISALNTRLQQTPDTNIKFLGVDTDDELVAAERFQQSLKANGELNFPVINDLDQAIVQQFKPMGFPALYIIKNGVVAAAHIGAVANIDQVIQKDLQTLLQD